MQIGTEKEFLTQLKLLKSKVTSEEFLASRFQISIQELLDLEPYVEAHYKTISALQTYPFRNTEGLRRETLTSYLQKKGLISVGDASILQGMTKESYLQVLTRMAELHLIRPSQLPEFGVLSKRLSESLHKSFRKFLFNVSEDRTEHLTDYHQVLREELGVDIVPMYCPMSELEGDRKFAAYYDSIFHDVPVGLRRSQWIDCDTPMHHPPDIVSLFTFFKFEAYLKLANKYSVGDSEPFRGLIETHLGLNPGKRFKPEALIILKDTYIQALKRISLLIDLNPAEGTPEYEELDTLGQLIMKYEERFYPLKSSDTSDS